MYIMQLFPVLTKARLPALLPSMLSAACMRGPEVAALPPVPAGFRERERERRERGGARPPGGGDNTNTAGVGGEDESVADKWREAVLSAVADLKTAQVRIVRICFWQAVSLCVFVRARVCHNGILQQPPPPSPPLLAENT